MRSRFLVGTLVLTTCLTRQTLVVAPTPTVRADSLARTAFAEAAIDLLERVAIADSLEPRGIRGIGRGCFARSNFDVCGHMEDSVVMIEFTQGGTGRFTDRNEQLRRNVLQRFREEFGEHRVRECTSHGSLCPRLAQIDSSA